MATEHNKAGSRSRESETLFGRQSGRMARFLSASVLANLVRTSSRAIIGVVLSLLGVILVLAITPGWGPPS